MVIAATALANEPQASKKPACNAQLRGHFWPEAANSDPQLARKLSQCGELEICSMATWKYKWRPVAVNVRQLGKTPQQPTAACSALMAETDSK